MTDRLACPCGKSSDAFSVYEDTGWGNCRSGKCDKPNWSPAALIRAEYAPGIVKPKEEIYIPKQAGADGPLRTIFDRGITKETLKKYDVEARPDRTIWPIFNPEGEPHAEKTRIYPKKFSVSGTLKGAGLMGRQVFPPGSAKAVTITEGGEDMLASFQMQGSKYPVVSIHGSASAVGDCRADFEYLNSFETIVLAFDADEAGQKAAKKVCEALPFPVGKIKIMAMKLHKDSCEYQEAGDSSLYMKEWWDAERYRPDGLVFGADMLDDMLREESYFMVDYPWKGLNQKTYGLRTSELVVLHAPPKVGKTSVIKAIEHLLLTDPVIVEKGYGVGFCHFEEPKKDTGLGLISIENGVPYHLPDVARPVDDITAAWNKLMNNNRMVLYDHFGSNDINTVLAKVRHMAAMGCKYIVIDHLSIIVSDQSGDERKQLDEIITKLKTLTMELDICAIAVIHENRKGEIRGTMGAEQLANIVIKLERDKLDANEWRANVTCVTVADNRFCGRCGIACYLYYDEQTARLTELTPEEVATYEAGGTADSGEFN